jgi:hypothetical protein
MLWFFVVLSYQQHNRMNSIKKCAIISSLFNTNLSLLNYAAEPQNFAVYDSTKPYSDALYASSIYLFSLRMVVKNNLIV